MDKDFSLITFNCLTPDTELFIKEDGVIKHVTFNYFDDISILRGRREEDFAPVKNADGNDSPDTAIKLYNNYWKKQKED